MKSLTPVELLAPAKNLEFGKSAISHGADAVYIGAPQFSARVAASNSVSEIEQLVKYAHIYKAKVYIALNTILFDNELEYALKLIQELYQIGIDGLIIQDMGLLELDLPPVTLIASTQTHNATAAKVQFLEKVGFKRVILARELSLKEISDIRKQTNIELEAFVHGALCVSYSGQCYMSQAACGRSGNRGVCAQPCRSAYDLIDHQGKILHKNKHLLSLKDLNLSDYLEKLLDSGITSFKIEGRLKDLGYVKNVTAFYRQKIDRILEQRHNYQKSSSGKVHLSFSPDPEKTFNREYTIHNIEGRKEKVCSFLTQKSLGQKVGKITEVGPNWFKLTGEVLTNGDGICFFDNHQSLVGTSVNRAEGTKVYPKDMAGVKTGVEVYRNHDHAFEKLLKNESGKRKIDIRVYLGEFEKGFVLKLVDEDNNTCDIRMEHTKTPAEKPEVAKKQTITQLAKLGDTPFAATDIEIETSKMYFIPAGVLNQLRRDAIKALEKLRLELYRPEDAPFSPNNFPYHVKSLSSNENIANAMAEKFYHRHGAETINMAYEKLTQQTQQVVMTTKHCIRYQLDACPIHQQSTPKLNDPIFLKDNQHTYRLDFDCKHCLMKVVLVDNK